MFDILIDKLISIEGGYVNNPNDSGGATNGGITEAVARSYGFKGSMEYLPMYIIKNIYRDKYWKPLKLDFIGAVSPSIVEELLDTGVNQGVGRASKYLQRSLNALNRNGKDFKDVLVDGSIGSKTIIALDAYVQKRGNKGELVMLRCLNSLQGAFYINLATARPKDEDFLFGWILNRVVI